MKALVSIHDVMPHTLERVERIIEWLNERGVPPVTLLVVPGLQWEESQIDRLRELADAGYELAAHGWTHTTTPRRLYHRLHAALISRKVAEHLDLDSKGVLALMTRSKSWFRENNLPVPEFYVPPAWALGPISKDDLKKAPYRIIETTRGLLEINGGTTFQSSTRPREADAQKRVPPKFSFQKLPLTGYEADTPFREFFLRRWNAAQAKSAKRHNLPLRISIHPEDLELRIADQMDEQIRSVDEFDLYPTANLPLTINE